ncbi:MAG: Gfo/Idh/MocA family oxidoreductase [Lentisphaerae bacterium]|nr:Gfo/Idh/MocA family oxidoreductase [Lentisphaerota bacterium]
MNETKRIRAGVLGLGESGELFAQAVAQRPDMELVGVVDIVEERAKTVAAQVNSQPFTDVSRLYDEGLDVAVIVTTNDAHVPLARAAMERGIHVICEKPIALRLAEAEELERMEKECGTLSVVPFGHNFSPAFWLATRLIDDGVIGDIISAWSVGGRGYGYYCEGYRHWAIVHPEKSGGWIIHHSVHDVGWFNKLLGSATSAFTKGSSTLPEKNAVEDLFGIVTYAGGQQALIADNMAAMHYGYAGINGTKGSIVFERKVGCDVSSLLLQTTPWQNGGTPERLDGSDLLPDHWLFREQDDRYSRSLNAMVDSIRAGRQLYDGIAEGVAAHRVAEALTRSLASGREESVH